MGLLKIDLEVVSEMDDWLPWIVAGELIEGDLVAGTFQFAAGFKDSVVHMDRGLDFSDDPARRQKRKSALEQKVSIAGDEREAVVAEDVEPEESGHIDGGASRFAGFDGGKVADHIGAEEELIADYRFVGRKDGLARGIAGGPDFVGGLLFHLYMLEYRQIHGSHEGGEGSLQVAAAPATLEGGNPNHRYP